MTLLHQVRRHGQQAFAEELQALAARYTNFQVRWVFSAEADGRLTADHIAALTAEHLLVCGPRGFVDTACGWWRDAGRGTSLQSESFSPLVVLTEEQTPEVRLSFARSPQACAELARLLAQQGEIDRRNQLFQESLGLLYQHLPS